MCRIHMLRHVLLLFATLSLLLVRPSASKCENPSQDTNRHKGGTNSGSGGDLSFVDSVTSLTDPRFNSHVKQSVNELWVVNFFAPWCSHCNRFKTIWNGAAEHFARPVSDASPAVNFGAANCERQPELCDSMEINFYPQVKSFYTA